MVFQVNENVLSAANLTKSFGALNAVAGVSFHIERGTCFGLLGPNGAGKTTTISMVSGLLNPDHGEILVEGQRLTVSTVGLKRLIGIVPQEIALYPELSAYNNLAFFGRLYGIKGKPLKTRIDECLELAGLANRANDKVGNFSGGMKRRLNIAVGLIHQPKLLILDEPTVGVDPQSRAQIIDTVKTLNNSGLAVLYTTHYMEEAERLCDKIAIMDAGKIIAEGTKSELVSSIGCEQKISISLDPGQPKEQAVSTLSALGSNLQIVTNENEVQILGSGSSELLSSAASKLIENSIMFRAIKLDTPNLEDVFLSLTGRDLRE